jgi:FKBP-type peptidyl-prolyl cis-trans isomerase SlyD
MSNDSEDEGDAPDASADEAAETAAEQGEETVEAMAEQQESETEETDAAEKAESGLQEDDVIQLDYTARTVEEGRLVDTTDPEVAEEEDVDAEQEFAPRTIVLGRGHIFPSVEDDIVGAEVGDTGSVTVPATEAFGTYDEEEVRTISKDKIPEDDRYPGGQVRIDGEEGFVETIIGGRARVDFNHPLAGDDIEYEYEVTDVVEDREEKASGLLELFLDLDLNVWFQTDTIEEEQLVESDDESDDAAGDETDADADDVEPPEPLFETVEHEEESLYIEATPELTMNQQWMMQKQQIGEDLIDLLGVDRIVVQEIIDGSGMGMPGMMGDMGGMGGGDIEEALDEADIDADELADELE